MRRMRLSRRTFLRGAGAALCLPFLDAMRPLTALAADSVPQRLAFVFVPNGVNVAAWFPRGEGAAYTLSPTLAPLAAHRDDLLVLSGLTLDGGRAHGDGPGDHARSAGSFLTAAHPVKTGGAGIRAGTSVDQVAARALERHTRLPSLELGTEQGARSGQCDSGYSCAYSSCISWRTPTTPNAKETVPRRVFDRLFTDGRPGESKEQTAARLRTRASVLDHVRGEATRLAGRLGNSDRAKLDEYLTGVRELERRLDMVATAGGSAGFEPPGTPADFREHVRLLYDIQVLAFRADLTRVASFMVGNAGSNRTYGMVDVPEAHHGLSHHGGDAAKLERIARIDRFHVEQFAYFLSRLAETKEGDARLLDSTLVLYGSGLADGNRHDHGELPILLAGRGAGVRPGRHVRFPANTPLANAYVTLLNAAGAPTESFADSSGPLALG